MRFFQWIKSFFGKKDEQQDDFFMEPEMGPEKVSAFKDIAEPRASFTVVGFDDDRIKVEFDWNKAFITHIARMGFIAETEEDSVQLFFYASSMRPTELSEEIQDLSAPEVQLSNSANRLVQ